MKKNPTCVTCKKEITDTQYCHVSHTNQETSHSSCWLEEQARIAERANNPLHFVPGISPTLIGPDGTRMTPERLAELKHMETTCTCTHFAEPHTFGWH